MTKEPFTQVATETRTLVEIPTEGPVVIRQNLDKPTADEHLSWMLARASNLHEKGVTAQAYLWIGFVQGVLATRGISLPELDLVNRSAPQLGSYREALVRSNALSGSNGHDREAHERRYEKLVAAMAMAEKLEDRERRLSIFWLGGLRLLSTSPESLALLDQVLAGEISFAEARERDETRERAAR